MNPVPSGRNLINFSQLNEKISSYELAHTHGRHNRGCPHKTPLLISVFSKSTRILPAYRLVLGKSFPQLFQTISSDILEHLAFDQCGMPCNVKNNIK